MQKVRKMTSKLDSRIRRRLIRPVAVAAAFPALLLIAGCSRAPTFNILGSFFPSWILCGVIGILLRYCPFVLRAHQAGGATDTTYRGVPVPCCIFHIHSLVAVLQL